MIKKLFYGGSLLFLVLAAAARAVAAPVEVRDIRLSGESESARVVLELSAETQYKFFTLEKPDRLVIDLHNARLARGVKPPAGKGIIEVVRTGTQPQQTLRVVMDLKSPTPARMSWTAAAGSKGRQLVIELGAGGSNDSPPTPVRVAHKAGEPVRDVIIAIDAGHGGKDPGAIGPAGTYEKNVVLPIARALAQRIDREPGMKAVLTRDHDIYISHRERMRRARAAGADMFISVHADSIRKPNVSGTSVYILSERGASSEAARWLAERENAADLVGGVSLGDKDDTLASVLLDLSQSASITASMSAAERVLAALDRVGEVRKPLVQQAGLLVLKSPDIPSMLVETGYISNPGEERRLKSDAHRRKLAEAIFNGVRDYFATYPPPGTRFAQERRTGAASVLAGPAAP